MKRIVTALCMLAMVGCGTAQKKPADVPPTKKEDSSTETGTGGRAAKGAAGGAAMGAVTCLSIAPAGLAAGGVGAIVTAGIALVCLPFGIVGGAVIGGTASAAASPSPARPAPTPAQVASKFRTQGRFVLVATGEVGPGDVVPVGALHVAMNTIALEGATGKRASLVINLDSATTEGGRSVVAQVAMSCESGTASVRHAFTYGEANGNGPLLKTEEHTPPIELKKPSAAFAAAVKEVCDAGPWWNTPAHVYGQ